ncbi:MAG TPA: formylglycine-generating enzyme family protein [Pirellulales bacterium]|nr:formylglycine-generating enzyme family protein [Pirellulales bacterium]
MKNHTEAFDVLAGLLGGVLGTAALAWAALRRFRFRAVTARPPLDTKAVAAEMHGDEPLAAQPANADVGSLVEGMLAQGRYALLLRRQLVSNLTPEQSQAAKEALERGMSLVPEGNVMLGTTDEDDDEANRGVVWHVGGLFLDRYLVTNRQYRQFVTGRGYEQMAIWDPQIWPAMLEFVDATGCPGPRYWRNGGYAAGEDEHPVVGLSWYEAAAYARWVGKRLPSEAEWVKAAAWPVPISDSRQSQRKFPWGDTMDRLRCNLWGSGPGRTVPVAEYSSGVSVGGAYQLIGNVWEWTTGNFGAGDCAGRDLTLPVPMKSIHGGAFDTYFEHQATCQFQSGESPLSRKHNIGFRCALGLCDIAAPRRSCRVDEQPDDEARGTPTDAASFDEGPSTMERSDEELAAVAQGDHA